MNPRELPEIVDAARRLDIPMMATQAAAIEALIREAYERGYQDLENLL